MAEHRQRSPITAAITLAGLVFLLLPLLVVVLFSFNASGSLSFPFTGFTLRWYERLFEAGTFRDAALNSLIVASVASLITLLLGTAAAYGLGRSSSRLRGPLALLFFLPITLPGLFVGIALLVFFARVDLRLSLTTVVIAHTIFVFPYFLIMSRAALDRLDPALEEAASDLGAGPWQVFTKVTLPQVWPVLVAASALCFALSFDEFVITFFTVGSEPTLPLYIWSSLRKDIDPTINAVSTVLMAISIGMWVLAFVVALCGSRRTGDTALLEA
jgi:spermidine/putrescine transport system permease protein